MSNNRSSFGILSTLRTASLLAAAGLAVQASAVPPPPVISYQGQLLTGGAPANGLFNMVFRLYSAPVGGFVIITDTHAGAGAVLVTNGLFTDFLGGGTLADGPSFGVFTTMPEVFAAFTNLYVEIVVNGTLLAGRQRVASSGFALNAGSLAGLNETQFLRSDLSDTFTGLVLTLDAESTLSILGNVVVADETDVRVSGGIANLRFTGTNLEVQIGDNASDALTLFSTMYMQPSGAPDGNQRIFFTNGGLRTGESFLWDDTTDRFELSDSLATSGPIQVGGANVAATIYSTFGTGTPVSAGMNNIGDVLVTDDLECLSSIIVSGNILMRSNAAEGNANIFFRNNASDTGEVFRWDDSNDRFFMSDGLEINGGSLTLSEPDGVSDIQSTGSITIRIDTDNNESGGNAGVFAIVANGLAFSGTPLLRLQSTDEADLELDSGVVTNAFDFAEAFRAAPGQDALEPGDVVTIATGPGLNEHCEKTDEANERVILGVVSTDPAYTAGMSFDAIEEADPALTLARDAALVRGDRTEANRIDKLMEAAMRAQWKPIAMVGRVPTKVDGKMGAIKAGDYLTSSSTSGHAMKLTGPGMALGVALEDFSGNGRGVISVFVRPMWHGAPTSSDRAELAAQGQRVASLERENTDLRTRLESIEAALATRVAQK